MTTLFDPVRVGDLDLTNRIVMAPLSSTARRAACDGGGCGRDRRRPHRAPPVAGGAKGYLDYPTLGERATA